MAKVIVVGAGIAGLGAAHRLTQAGIEVTVLEAEDTAGGRMRSVPWRDTWMDLGAAEIGSSFHELLALCSELGLSPIPHYGDEDLTMHVYKQGRAHTLKGFTPAAWLRFSAMTRLDRIRLAKLIPSFVRQLWRKRGSHFEPWRAAWCDDESIDTWLARVSPTFLEYAMEPLFEGQATWSPEQIGRGMFTYLMAENTKTELFTFEEGLGQVTRTLAARLAVTTGARVTSVRAGSTPVRVEYEVDGTSHVAEADFAVVAVPGTKVTGIVEGLDDVRRDFFEQIEYVTLEGHTFALREAPEGVPDYLYFPRLEETDIARLGWQVHPIDPTKRFFFVLMKQKWYAAHRDVSDAECVTAVRDAVRRWYPQVDPLIEDCFLTRWPEGLPIFPAGYLRRLAAVRELEPLAGVAFAGDYLCGPATGFAYVSGERAAAEALRRLGS